MERSIKGEIRPNSSLCIVMIWCWEFPEEEEIRLLLFCGFLEETTAIDRFRCWKTHPSPSEIPSRYFTVLFRSIHLSVLHNSASEGARSDRGVVYLHEIRARIAVSFRPSWDPARVHRLSHFPSVSDDGILQSASFIHLGCNSFRRIVGVIIYGAS